MNKNINFDGADIEEYKFYQDKCPILINNIDINKIVVSNKFSFGKKDFIGYKDAKKITHHYAYFFQKWVHIEKTLIELNFYLLINNMNYKKDIMKFAKKSRIVSKRNLIVNLYMIKNNWKLK